MLSSIFLLVVIVIVSTMAMPCQRNSIERCESGSVCKDTCYYNGERINCAEQTTLKSVVFNSSFDNILPSINLKLIQMDSTEAVLNSDIIMRKENLTSYGMNIRFSIPKDSTNQYFCVEWLACTLNTQ